jgi:hypothetical protein
MFQGFDTGVEVISLQVLADTGNNLNSALIVCDSGSEPGSTSSPLLSF